MYNIKNLSIVCKFYSQPSIVKSDHKSRTFMKDIGMESQFLMFVKKSILLKYLNILLLLVLKNIYGQTTINLDSNPDNQPTYVSMH